MNRPVSLIFGGFGLLFISAAALQIGCSCILPSLIFVLLHAIMVAIAFPFFLVVIMKDERVPSSYAITVLTMSLLNAVLMYSVSYIDTTISDLFEIAAGMELMPLPFLLANNLLTQDTNYIVVSHH